MPWRKAWIQGTVGYSINAAKEGKAPGRCGIPAEIWKHTWRYETRLLDFLRREKFCSKAWFKQEHTTANFPCAQGTFYLTSCGPLRRGITWSLQGAPDPQLFSFGLWLVSDVQWTQSCHWVDKLLAPYTHYLGLGVWSIFDARLATKVLYMSPLSRVRRLTNLC